MESITKNVGWLTCTTGHRINSAKYLWSLRLDKNLRRAFMAQMGRLAKYGYRLAAALDGQGQENILSTTSKGASYSFRVPTQLFHKSEPVRIFPGILSHSTRKEYPKTWGGISWRHYHYKTYGYNSLLQNLVMLLLPFIFIRGTTVSPRF